MAGYRWVLIFPLFVAAALIALLFSPVSTAVRLFSMIGLIVLLLTAGYILTASKLLGPARARHLLANIFVAAFVIGLSLVAGEVAMRWYYRDVTTAGSVGGYFAKRWHMRNPPASNRWGFRERDYLLKVAEDSEDEVPRRERKPLGGEVDVPTLKRWLRHWTLVRHRGGAERTLLVAFLKALTGEWPNR